MIDPTIQGVFLGRRSIAISAARTADAVAALTRIVATEDPAKTVIVIRSPFIDGVARPPETVQAGPDLKRLLANPAGTTVDGVEVVAGVFERHESNDRNDGRWLVIGPDAGGIIEGDGALLVLSASGAGFADILSGLPAVRLAVDVGLDRFGGLERLTGLLAATLPTGIEAVVCVGLSPTSETMIALQGMRARVPIIAWDPCVERVSAWETSGIAASTDLVAVGCAAQAIIASPGITTDTSPTSIRNLWILSTSPTLAASCQRTLVDKQTSHTSGFILGIWDDDAADTLMSELPADVPIGNPLLIPTTPAFAGLPPRHLRHLRTALVTVANRSAGASRVPLVVIAVENSDPALAELEATAASASVPTMVVTARTIASRLAAVPLAARARHAGVTNAEPVNVDTRLKTLVMAAVLMRRKTLGDHEALQLVHAVSGIPLAPRAPATTSGQAVNISKQNGFPVAIGVTLGHQSLRTSGRDIDATRTVAPAPRVATTVEDVSASFEELGEGTDFAWEPRFVAAIGNPAGSARELWHLHCDDTPIAWRFRATTPVGDIAGHISPSRTSPALPAFANLLLTAIVRVAAELDVIRGATIVVAAGSDGSEPRLVDASVRLGPPA